MESAGADTIRPRHFRVMKVKEREIQLKNGQIATMRSPGPEDAEAVDAHRYLTSAQTHYMGRNPEEVDLDTEARKKWLTALEEDPREFGISVFCEGGLVADCCVTTLRNLGKFRHRATFGISIRKDFWGVGIGSLLLAEAVRTARENGFEQLELGVFSDNPRAIHVYEKAGFQKCGVLPRAFKLKDGTYRDEVMMVLFL